MLPLVCDDVIGVSIGCVCVRNRQTQKALDSYQVWNIRHVLCRKNVMKHKFHYKNNRTSIWNCCAASGARRWANASRTWTTRSSAWSTSRTSPSWTWSASRRSSPSGSCWPKSATLSTCRLQTATCQDRRLTGIFFLFNLCLGWGLFIKLYQNTISSHIYIECETLNFQEPTSRNWTAHTCDLSGLERSIHNLKHYEN